MKRENKDKIDISEFTNWITNNVHRILNFKQTQLFRNMDMSFNDLKLFGKSNDAYNYYEKYRDEFERDQFNWILEYKTNY